MINFIVNYFKKHALKKFPLRGFTNNRLDIPLIESLPDEELQILNHLLPWASFVVDSNGRRFGLPYSLTKRVDAQEIPDKRIVELNKRYPLKNSHVLELGCFEGIHTAALSGFAKRVTAIDSRIENVVKTIIRSSMLGYKPDVFYLNLESIITDSKVIDCDVLHHVGVLYHLADPVSHLNQFLSHTNNAIMLDTHVATKELPLQEYSVDGRLYRHYKYSEKGRLAPFAGMCDHAKWLLTEDILYLLQHNGFNNIDVAEKRQERNGTRILVYADKQSKT